MCSVVVACGIENLNFDMLLFALYNKGPNTLSEITLFHVSLYNYFCYLCKMFFDISVELSA